MDNTSTSTDEQGVQEDRNHGDTLLNLYTQTVQLFSSSLGETSIKVMQEKLQVMQRSSYYLQIHRDVLPNSGQEISHRSDSTIWSLIDQQRLQRAMSEAKTVVMLILTILEQTYKEIISGRRELEAFIVQYDQGLVDSDTAASVQQTLAQTHKYISDFDTRTTCYIVPLNLTTQLISSTFNFELTPSLAIKKPVVFDRTESRSRSNSVYLCWEVVDKQSKDSNEQFEIQVKSLYPVTNDQDQLYTFLCQSSCTQVNNLISDRCYEFSVKRVDTFSLVYGMWTDTIILKTLCT